MNETMNFYILFYLIKIRFTLDTLRSLYLWENFRVGRFLLSKLNEFGVSLAVEIHATRNIICAAIKVNEVSARRVAV